MTRRSARYSITRPARRRGRSPASGCLASHIRAEARVDGSKSIRGASSAIWRTTGHASGTSGMASTTGANSRV